MKESIVTVLLAIGSFCMLIIAVVGILTHDGKAPVISLEGKNNLTYTEGDSYEELLKNMTAEDERDGDVTDSLRVGNIYVTGEDRAMVVYVAKDKANNIAKLKREVRYEAKEQTIAEAEKEAEPEEEAAVPTEATADTATTEPQGQTAQEGLQTQTTGTPVITMIQNAATLKVGEAFNVLRYIQSAVDTDGTSLSRYIHAEGAYDMNQPGTYSIRVYATSPSGTVSNIETFTLTVEP